jgi:hypothetical protein
MEKGEAHAGKLLRFPKRKNMSTKTQGRYGGQTIPLNAEEEMLLEVLHTWSGIRKATLARMFFYRGIAAYLKDKKLEVDNDEQTRIREMLLKYVESEPEMKIAMRVVQQRAKRDGNGNRNRKPA